MVRRVVRFQIRLDIKTKTRGRLLIQETVVTTSVPGLVKVKREPKTLLVVMILTLFVC